MSWFVNGSLGNTAVTVTVASGATLAGSGSITGATTIAAGATLAPGATSGATGALATRGLTLNGTSLLAYDLGAANVIGSQNDVTNVTGNLTLDGTINVTNAGNFASMPGSYRLFNYTGALTTLHSRPADCIPIIPVCEMSRGRSVEATRSVRLSLARVVSRVQRRVSRRSSVRGCRSPMVGHRRELERHSRPVGL